MITGSIGSTTCYQYCNVPTLGNMIFVRNIGNVGNISTIPGASKLRGSFNISKSMMYGCCEYYLGYEYVSTSSVANAMPPIRPT